jgi:small subunit ribosomal protein S2
VAKKAESKAKKGNSGLLVPVEQYLSSGIHIGTIFRTGDMRKYIFKTRPDRLNVMDIQKIDFKIRMAGKFLAQYEPGDIVVVARRKYAQHAARKFAETIGAKAIVGRFVPGTFTNPQAKEFMEPSVVVVSDPIADKEAVDEAARVRIPVVAICNTNNTFRNIDFAIPGNNRGKRALALIFWLLAREYLLNKGIIKSYDEFNVPLSEFEGGKR